MAESFRELRAEIAAALKPVLGKGFAIFPAPTDLDDIQKPTLVLVRESVTKLEAAPGAKLNNLLVLSLVLPQMTSEDDLDDALEDTIQALDDTGYSTWTTAERGVWSETFPSYRITFNAPTQRKK